MPNRELREAIRHSETVAKLTDKEFRLFTLLISCVDDFGRFYADPRLVKSACFPYDTESLANITKTLTGLHESTVIDLYVYEGKEYLQMHQWKQRKRAVHSKFPDINGLGPLPYGDGPPQADDGQASGVRVRITNNDGEVSNDGNDQANTHRFVRPTPEEVTEYGRSIGYDVDGAKFCDFYTSKGWKVGQTPMKDWKAAVRTWKKKDQNESKPKDQRAHWK